MIHVPPSAPASAAVATDDDVNDVVQSQNPDSVQWCSAPPRYFGLSERRARDTNKSAASSKVQFRAKNAIPQSPPLGCTWSRQSVSQWAAAAWPPKYSDFDFIREDSLMDMLLLHSCIRLRMQQSLPTLHEILNQRIRGRPLRHLLLLINIRGETQILIIILLCHTRCLRLLLFRNPRSDGRRGEEEDPNGCTFRLEYCFKTPLALEIKFDWCVGSSCITIISHQIIRSIALMDGTVESQWISHPVGDRVELLQ